MKKDVALEGGGPRHASIHEEMSAAARVDDEEVTKRLFLQLDPHLRLLLAVQQKLQHNLLLLPRSGDGARTRTTHNDDDRPESVRLLQAQDECLQQLHQSLSSLREDLPKTQLSNSLQVMLQYLSLPLLVVMKAPPLDWNLASHTTATEEAQEEALSPLSPARLVRRSLLWKCVEKAADLWVLLCQSVQGRVNPSHETLWLQALFSCTAALPSGQQISDNQRLATTTTVLDRGESCLLALLGAIDHLVLRCSSTAMADSMDGGLIARIADTCVSLLTPPTVETASTTTVLSLRAPPSSSLQRRTVPAELQLAANHTLLSLIRAIPNPRVWQRAFPGCLAGLYRNLLPHLRVKGGSQTTALVVSSLQSLTALLQITLTAAPLPTKNLLTAAASLQQLVQKANETYHQRPSEEDLTLPAVVPSSTEGETEEQFFQHVESRVPPLLLILVRLVTISSSSRVRMEGAQLMGVILTVRERWGTHSELTMTAYESCLVLSRDYDNDVVQASQQVLSDAPDELVPATKVLELIEELVPLAHRNSPLQLQTKFRLLLAILSRAGKRTTKTLRTLLTSPESSVPIQTSLVSVFDLDFTSPYQTKLALIQVLDPAQPSTAPTTLPFRYLDDESRDLAIAFVSALGKQLRTRSTAIWVDTFLARFFRAFDARAQQHVPALSSPSHVHWLHEWIGTMPVVVCLLRGAFEQGAKGRNILSDLTNSILPLLTSEQLMSVPCQETQIAVDENFAGSPWLRRSGVSPSPLLIDVASSALQGNMALINSLLDLIGVLAELQGSAFRRSLSVCLYCMVEKSTPSSPIYGAARTALDRLTRACAYDSRHDMIVDNIGSLLGTALARLRVPGGRSLTSGAGLDCVVLDTATTLTLVLQWLAELSSGTELPSPALSSVQDVVKELMVRLDHSSSRLVAHPEKMIKYIRLFGAALLLLRKDCSSAPPEEECEAAGEPWLQLLNPFLVSSDLPKDGFACYREQQDEPHGDPSNATSVPVNLDRHQLTHNTHFVDQLLSRCCYSLTSPSLAVQLVGVDALIHGFSYLGWIATAVPRDAEEFNGPTTAVLRQVHATWFALASRLDAVTSTVTGSTRFEGRASLLIVGAPTANGVAGHPPQGESRLLLAKMVRLLAVLTECAGDFVAPRLRASVWPQLSRVLQMFLGRMPSRPAATLSSSPPPTSRASTVAISESEQALLLSVLEFFERVYRAREVGQALAPLIPATGALLLPFLAFGNGQHLHDDSVVSFGARRAVESMLRIDADALWRPLMELSGRPWPACPLQIMEQNVPPTSSGTMLSLHRAGMVDHRLTRAASELLDFAKGLPEQPLF